MKIAKIIKLRGKPEHKNTAKKAGQSKEKQDSSKF